MAIDFRNPLAGGALLTRLRTMLGGTGQQPETADTVTSGRRYTDRVTLSSTALRIADGLAGAQAGAERIAAIKQAIETGDFRIDSARIADKVSLQYGGRR